MDDDRERTVAAAWSKDDPYGSEYADVTLGPDRLAASGVAIGSEPLPYRLDYTLETAEGFVTRRVRVATRGDGWSRALELERSEPGSWEAHVELTGSVDLPLPGGDTAGLGGALDVDLGLSPLFNSMPVLRHGLHVGGTSVEFLMIWISVPDLRISASAQRYTFLRADGPRAQVRFETVGDAERFVAEIEFDGLGLVVDYPGIARRIATNT